MRAQHSDVIGEVFLSLCEMVDTPRSLAAWLCYKYNQVGLVELDFPATATDVPTFAGNYLVTSYLSKYKGLRLPHNTRKVAIDAWIASESKCLDTNRRLRAQRLDPSTGSAFEADILSARRKIAAVLGPFCGPTRGARLSKFLGGCRWGGGATFDVSRSSASLDNKISGPISVTGPALAYARAVLESDPHWFAALSGIFPSGPYCVTSNNFTVVRGSRHLTVPKNAKTDRSIAAEPTFNGFLQQGVHSYLRRRLKRFGVDLDDQSINQRRAQDAYSSGLSTLDLSAASDTISTELVYDLLPLDWALFLDDLRSKETLVDGRWVKLEKFASMGNAFCFELETLIFWALSSAVADRHEQHGSVTVYGDDIIVGRIYARQVVSLLEWCGFAVNTSKSYIDGDFYESCGKHYFRGIDVTPVYQKELVSAPSEIIRAHNRLWRLRERHPAITDGIEAPLSLLRRVYPFRKAVPRIPSGCTEDGGFLSRHEVLRRDPNHGFRCLVLDYCVSYGGAMDVAVYAYKLRNWAYSNALRNGSPGNIISGRFRTRWRFVPFAAVEC